MINRMLMEKLFSKTFNILDFVIRLIDNYIPPEGCMGVSIVEHSIELAKILYKYALVSVDDGDRLLTMLEKKINSLKNIELASGSLEIRNSQMLIRQNYIEIIILHIYNTLDNHILT